MTTAFYLIEGEPPQARKHLRKPGWAGLIGSQVCCKNKQGQNLLCCINNMWVKKEKQKPITLREFLDSGGKLSDIE